MKLYKRNKKSKEIPIFAKDIELKTYQLKNTIKTDEPLLFLLCRGVQQR